MCVCVCVCMFVCLCFVQVCMPVCVCVCHPVWLLVVFLATIASGCCCLLRYRRVNAFPLAITSPHHRSQPPSQSSESFHGTADVSTGHLGFPITRAVQPPSECTTGSAGHTVRPHRPPDVWFWIQLLLLWWGGGGGFGPVLVAAQSSPSCPVGSFFNATNARCVTCPGGAFCVGGANPAIACPPGTTTSSTSTSTI